MIAIIDYDAGNIRSVQNALEFLGQETILTRDRDEMLNADGVILPGVGSFGDAMEKLHTYKLINTIKEVVNRQIPFLGICLGLQLLFERSDESDGVEGLKILKGEILHIPAEKGVKIPHIGWNSLEFNNKGRLFDGISENAYVYFVHSYYLKAENEEIVKASAEYGTQIDASVEQGNVYACQFHPEKSGEVGLKILENFIKITGGKC